VPYKHYWGQTVPLVAARILRNSTLLPVVLEMGTCLPDSTLCLIPSSFIFQPSTILDDEKSGGNGRSRPNRLINITICRSYSFFLYAEPLVPEVCTTVCAVLSLDRCNIPLGWVSRVACCILLCPDPALLGADISPRVWQVTTLAKFSRAKSWHEDR
jgi:hypothetical protein